MRRRRRHAATKALADRLTRVGEQAPRRCRSRDRAGARSRAPSSSRLDELGERARDRPRRLLSLAKERRRGSDTTLPLDLQRAAASRCSSRRQRHCESAQQAAARESADRSRTSPSVPMQIGHSARGRASPGFGDMEPPRDDPMRRDCAVGSPGAAPQLWWRPGVATGSRSPGNRDALARPDAVVGDR